MRSHNDNVLSQRKTNRCGKLRKASSLCSHISSCKKYPTYECCNLVYPLFVGKYDIPGFINVNIVARKCMCWFRRGRCFDFIRFKISYSWKCHVYDQKFRILTKYKKWYRFSEIVQMPGQSSRRLCHDTWQFAFRRGLLMRFLPR